MGEASASEAARAQADFKTEETETFSIRIQHSTLGFIPLQTLARKVCPQSLLQLLLTMGKACASGFGAAAGCAERVANAMNAGAAKRPVGWSRFTGTD